MTVPTSISRQDFVGTGSTGPISFPHRLDQPEELELWVRKADGLLDFKGVYNFSYFVSIASDFNSATVTLSASLALAVLGKTCSLMRIAPLTQSLDVSTIQRFTDRELEKGFDRSVMRDQQLQEIIADLSLELDLALTPIDLVQAVTDAQAAAASAAANAAIVAGAGVGFYRAFLGGL